MECKHCGAPLDEEAVFCPVCGAELTADEQAEETCCCENEETCCCGSEETACADAMPAVEQKKKGKAAIAVAVAIAVVAVAALFAVKMFKPTPDVEEPSQVVEESENAETVQPESGETAQEQPEVDLPSYTITPEEATDEVLDTEIAVCGERVLRNRDLPYYYWEAFYSFASQYGQYLSMIIDPSVGLDKQLYDDTHTWQQQLLDIAFEQFADVSALCKAAEEEGFVLDEQSLTMLQTVRDDLEKIAEEGEYDNEDAMVQETFGPYSSLEGYLEFFRGNLTASAYLDTLIEQIEYTDADISAYYDANAETYELNRVLKVDRPMVNVRHVLIRPAEEESGEITEAAWAAAKEEAERVYAEWEAGAKTEEAFAELAVQYSADGNAAQGGIYEYVYPGQMVDSFNDWCFDESRVAGDYGLVETEFGYHIMYLSAITEEVYWFEVAEADYLTERTAQIREQLRETYPTENHMEKAAIVDLALFG